MPIVFCVVPFVLLCPSFSASCPWCPTMPTFLCHALGSLRHVLRSLPCPYFFVMSFVLCHAICSLSCPLCSASCPFYVMPIVLCHAFCYLSCPLCLASGPFYVMAIVLYHVFRSILCPFLCISPFYVMPIVFCHAFRSLSCPLFSASRTSSCGLQGEGSLFKAGNHCRFIIAPRPSPVTPCLFYSTACLNFVLCILMPRSPSVLVSQSLSSRGDTL